MSDIIPASGIELFTDTPDYAINALWLEWERMRRKNPPDNILCTSITAFQKFCQLVNDTGNIFPSTYTSRETLLDLTLLPAVSYKRDEVKRLQQILEDWDESDNAIYVAFTYEGARYRSLIEAVMQKLQPKYNQLRQQYLIEP